jgi:hypothetical protein
MTAGFRGPWFLGRSGQAPVNLRASQGSDIRRGNDGNHSQKWRRPRAQPGP